jgi:hypothetical protein
MALVPRVITPDYINNCILRPDIAGGSMLIFTHMNAGNLELFVIKERGELRDVLGYNNPINVPPCGYAANSGYFQTDPPVALPVNIVSLPGLLGCINATTFAQLMSTFNAARLAGVANDISLGGTIIQSINAHHHTFRLKCFHSAYTTGGVKGFIGGSRKGAGAGAGAVAETPVQNAIREFMEETGIHGLLQKAAFNLLVPWDNQTIFHEAGFIDVGIIPGLGRNLIVYHCNDLERGLLERIYHSFRRDVGYPEFRNICNLPNLNPRSVQTLACFNNWLPRNGLPAVLANIVPAPGLPPLQPNVQNRIISNANQNPQISLHGGYKEKYLKYKKKYLTLRNELFN